MRESFTRFMLASTLCASTQRYSRDGNFIFFKINSLTGSGDLIKSLFYL